MHVLGIDAGGSKTVCLLADGDGRVLAEARGPGANLQTSGELEVEKVLHQVIDETIGDRGVRPHIVCVGVAGVDRPRDSQALATIMRRLGFKSGTLVVNDALVALVAGAGIGPGLVIVAGTGSIAYGRDAAGHAARAGGWGYLLGDEGAGFWIGRLALSAVVRQSDGRAPDTMLTRLVLEHMRLDSPRDLIQVVYEGGVHRQSMAEVAMLVRDAADAGDAVARDILARAAAELVAAAASVVSKLEMRGLPFRTVLTGGVFRGMPAMVAAVTAGMAEVAPRSEVRSLDVEPALGAVALALEAARGRVAVPTYL